MSERTATDSNHVDRVDVASRALWIVPAILGLDQGSKYLARHLLDPSRPWPQDAEYFRLTYIHNPGAAFGLDLGSLHLHTIISVAALGLLIWLFRSLPAHARLSQFALAMVLGGALGNIVDRLIHDAGVVDFFDIGLSERWRWPIFNIADTFVTIGIFLLVLGYRRQPPREREAGADTAPMSFPEAPSSPQLPQHTEGR